MAHVVEGVSLFGVTPHFGSIPAGGIIILASYIIREVPLVEDFPVDSEVPVFEEIHTQDFVGNESTADLGVPPEVCSNIEGVFGHGMQVEGASSTVVITPVGDEHLC